MPKLKIKESVVQRQVLDYLTLQGYLCWRNNTGAMAGSHKGRNWFVRFGRVGSGDILGITHKCHPQGAGKFFSIEIKALGGKPTEEQAKFIADVKASGGISFVAYGVDEVMMSGF